MNKIKYLFTVLLMLHVMCGCGESVKSSEPAVPDNPTTQVGKTLIVYFSWSGNTRAVANTIQELTGYDIVEIEVEEPYSSVYNEVTVRARRELDNDIRPALVTRVENIDEYDTLIVGTPIWSSRLAPPVKSFLAMYDLAGKKIAPFCTHGGSGTAQSVNNIRSVCPDSEILQSLAISGNRSASARNDVIRWLQTIGVNK